MSVFALIKKHESVFLSGEETLQPATTYTVHFLCSSEMSQKDLWHLLGQGLALILSHQGKLWKTSLRFVESENNMLRV